MRLISFILSIYFLVLTLVPCVDQYMDANGNKIEILAKKLPDNPHDGLDHCSPFCSCSCCSTSVYLVKTIINTSNISIPISVKFTYFQSFISAFSSKIWQPPKF